MSSDNSLVKPILTLFFGLIGFVAIAKLYDSADHDQKEEKLAEERYLKIIATPQQLAANEHFNKCAQYRRTPLSVWSERQKHYALVGEGCYADDRDDPRYPQATYPWNDIKPWAPPK